MFKIGDTVCYKYKSELKGKIIGIQGNLIRISYKDSRNIHKTMWIISNYWKKVSDLILYPDE